MLFYTLTQQWQASIFSLQYPYLIQHTGQENKGNDHHAWNVLMLVQILLTSTIRNIWRTLRRICILILELKRLTVHIWVVIAQRVNQMLSCVTYFKTALFNPLSPSIIMQILLAGLHVFCWVAVGSTCLKIRTIHLQWSIP